MYEGAAMADLIIAAVGDSIMWGQGLKEADRFVTVSANAIGELLGRQPVIRRLAHSGAVTTTAHDGWDKKLEARRAFIDTYPHLFHSQAEKDAFLDADEGAGEGPAASLHGEIPRSYPTVTHQLTEIDAADVDIAFINGGANDIDFEEYLASRGKTFGAYDLFFEDVFKKRLRTLLRQARKTFPRATLIYTGYYSAFSNISSRGRIEELFIHLKGAAKYEVIINEIFNALGLGVDVDRAVEDVIARSLYGQSRALYWITRTVADLNASEGLKVIFAYPGFSEENALFASQPFVHQEYKISSVQDDMWQVRRDNCRRAAHLEKLEEMYDHMRRRSGPGDWNPPSKSWLKSLRMLLDGPTSLLAVLDGMIESPSNTRHWEPLTEALKQEVSRITTCLIGSFMHPNQAGAAKYAQVIVERFEMQRRLAIRMHFERMSAMASGATPGISVRSFLRRFGLSPEAGLRALCLQHVFVDSIAVRITTRSGKASTDYHSSPHVKLEIMDRIYLQLGPGKRWWLNQGYGKLSTGPSDFFTSDAFGSLHLGDITELTLQRIPELPLESRAPGLDPGPQPHPWTPESITMSLNGVDVFSASIDRPLNAGESLSLPYPVPLRPRRGTTPVVPQG